MKNQKIRSMKVHEQSGYNYKATPNLQSALLGYLLISVVVSNA